MRSGYDKDLQNRHHVVIIGAGFGGIEVANELAGAEVDVTIIDRRNHHLFQPLLYQVAGASLSTSEIAWPIRYLFRNRPEVNTLMAEVEGIDHGRASGHFNNGSRQTYDTLVLATGATHAYFGHDEWGLCAGVEDAGRCHGHSGPNPRGFRGGRATSDPQQRAALQTFVIIGGGPTGAELAGTIAELARDTLARDFRSIDPSTSRVVLIEAPRLLSVFPEDLSAYTRIRLEKLGVEVVLGTPVTECSADGVVYGGKPFRPRPSSGPQGSRRLPRLAGWVLRLIVRVEWSLVPT